MSKTSNVYYFSSRNIKRPKTNKDHLLSTTTKLNLSMLLFTLTAINLQHFPMNDTSQMQISSGNLCKKIILQTTI